MEPIIFTPTPQQLEILRDIDSLKAHARQREADVIPFIIGPLGLKPEEVKSLVFNGSEVVIVRKEMDKK